MTEQGNPHGGTARKWLKVGRPETATEQEVWEFSAGGLVVENSQVLLVRVRNLKKERVWTFPKGHVEGGETPREAALREVEEETGYRCRILKPMGIAQYRFCRQKELVNKKVRWFLMRALWKKSKHDTVEILGTRWVSLHRAAKMLRYPSDLKLLEQLTTL